MSDPVDLSDLATGGADAPRKQRTEGPKNYNVAVVQFWDRYTCRCGAEYEGPRAGYYPAYFKRWIGSRKGYEYKPITDADSVPFSLPRYTSLEEKNIPVCPWCTPAFDGYPDDEPLAPASNTEQEQEDDDNDNSTPEEEPAASSDSSEPIDLDGLTQGIQGA